MQNNNNLPLDTYVCQAEYGNCKVCKFYQDLRCGVCFKCSNKVSGHYDQNGKHHLWEIDNPKNSWYVYSFN